MDAVYMQNTQIQNDEEANPIPELAAWFSVPGDMDDFIFYGESDIHSNR